MTAQSWDTASDGGWAADPWEQNTYDEDEWCSDGWDKIYSPEICKAALRGENLPTSDPNRMSYATRFCVLRGIRHHHGFGAELLSGSAERDPAFARALHARAIMSNEIPNISAAEEFPYCIWYPDTATEETYRQLARRYPNMRYQVGRACAVAGYNDLYSELDLLPEISIAEEARDSVIRNRRHGGGQGRSNGSQEIFDQIVGHHVRWQVMDDYERRVDLDCPKPAKYGLNGDTAVFSTLELRRDFRLLRRDVFSQFNWEKTRRAAPYTADDELAPCYFNITEDWNVDEYTSKCGSEEGCHDELMSEEMTELLWNPLPMDLPWGNKDLLILMAAYYGNIDRFARLRRPQPVSKAEQSCTIRGIYHSTMFAKWCSLQHDTAYASAINARFIMSNDLSRITEQTPNECVPYQIWYPQRACAETYLELLRRKPASRDAVARALIVADYEQAWDSIAGDIEPYDELIDEAEASANPHYAASLKKICAERGQAGRKLPSDMGMPASKFVERTTTTLVASLRVGSVACDNQETAIYDVIGVDASEVELFAAAPRELRPSGDFYQGDMADIYRRLRGQSPPKRGGWQIRRGRARGRGMS